MLKPLNCLRSCICSWSLIVTFLTLKFSDGPHPWDYYSPIEGGGELLCVGSELAWYSLAVGVPYQALVLCLLKVSFLWKPRVCFPPSNNTVYHATFMAVGFLWWLDFPKGCWVTWSSIIPGDLVNMVVDEDNIWVCSLTPSSFAVCSGLSHLTEGPKRIKRANLKKKVLTNLPLYLGIFPWPWSGTEALLQAECHSGQL